MATQRQIAAVQQTIKKWEGDRHGPCELCDQWTCNEGGSVFGNGCPLDTKTLQCDQDESPYSLYWWACSNEYQYEADKQAKRIVNACKRWIKKNT